jgi:tetratricopeptide (TPR) repeat protein
MKGKRFHRHKVPAVALLVALLALSISAQSGGGRIEGRVLLPGGHDLYESVRVTLQSLRGIKLSIFTDDRGKFQFQGVTPDIYDVVVEPDLNLYDLTSTKVEVFPGAPALVTVVLKAKTQKALSSPRSNSVSATELDENIPKKARKEFERASDASKAGKTGEAVDHLRSAIAIYPKYLMAHNDLGALLLSEGKLEEAAEELRVAINLDPKAFNPHLNLGIVLVQQHQFHEAAGILKTACLLDSGAPSARLYLGIALAALDEPSAETELKAAHDLGGTTYAVALFHLGQFYLNHGNRKDALAAFQQFLRESPKGLNSAEAERLVQILH